MNENLMLAKTLGGSRAYHLHTDASDWDYRGVFLNTELRFVLGLDKYEHQEFSQEEDTKYKEFRAYLNLLRQANTECIELLFTDDFLEVDPLFLELQTHKYELLDTDRLFKTLLGYMSGEKLLANGTRTGRLGGARKTQIDRLGFSPKNFVQILRLAFCGTTIFTNGIYPVNVKKHDILFAEQLLDIKYNPQSYTKDQLNKMTDEAELKLKAAYDNRKFNYTFDNDLANNFVLTAYYPLLTKMHDKLFMDGFLFSKNESVL